MSVKAMEPNHSHKFGSCFSIAAKFPPNMRSLLRSDIMYTVYRFYEKHYKKHTNVAFISNAL